MIGHGQAIKELEDKSGKLFKLKCKEKNKRKCERKEKVQPWCNWKGRRRSKRKNVIYEAIVGEDFPRLMADRKKLKKE